jgi:acetolactate synthase-1/2/3 large subunit
MAKITGGDAVYETLVSLGVKHVFGIVSVHNIPIYDAIGRGSEITPIDVRHEQGALHAADGYARATGKLGVAITSTGPGATNSMTGLYEAGFASSPVLMITGQVESIYYGKGKGVLHEAENQLAMLRTVTRACASPRFADEIVPELRRVAEAILTGRPQPGALELPVDLQYEQVDSPTLEEFDPRRQAPEASALVAAVDLLARSTRTVIWAGGGVVRSQATAELIELAEALNAPVFTTPNGRGAIPEDHPLFMGVSMQACRKAVQDADLLVAVGTRFQGGATNNFTFSLPGSLIHIDADPAVINRNYVADVPMVADARLGLRALMDRTNPNKGDRDFLDRLRTARDAGVALTRQRMGPDHESIMDTIREQLPRRGNIVRDATVPAYVWGNTLLPVYESGTSIHTTSAAIGPGLPLAIGASIGTGEKSVVIQGDGGFMLNLSELATAAQYQVPVIVCVFNNRGYGVLRNIEASRFDGRNFGVDLHTPDFVAVAEGMGVKGHSVRGVDEFRTAFADAMKATGPVLLDIDMDSLSPMLVFNSPKRPAASQ